MYGWWKTFEHYSVPGSQPIAMSASVAAVEMHSRSNTDSYTKRPVIGRLTGDQWRLVFKLEKDERVWVNASQVVKYERGRAGGPRGNMGPLPPEAETAIVSIDLDG